MYIISLIIGIIIIKFILFDLDDIFFEMFKSNKAIKQEKTEQEEALPIEPVKPKKIIAEQLQEEEFNNNKYKLHPTEIFVMENLYGYNGKAKKDVKELADSLGIATSYIIRVKRKAISKMNIELANSNRS